MVIAAFIALILVAIAGYIALERERTHWALLLSDQSQEFDSERLHWEKERQNLLDRIQAPERAADQALLGDPEDPGPSHVPFDDDREAMKAIAERITSGD